MKYKLFRFILVYVLTFTVGNLCAQFHTIEIEIDSSKHQPDYVNGNPRGVDETTLDSNTRISGNYPRGFFPNQKIISTTNSKNNAAGSNPKQVFIKREDDEK